MDGLMGSRINAPCPICGSMLHPTLEDVRQERTIYCPNGHQVNLVDQDDGAQKLDAELHKLDRQMRKLGIKTTFKRR